MSIESALTSLRLYVEGTDPKVLRPSIRRNLLTLIEDAQNELQLEHERRVRSMTAASRRRQRQGD